MVEQWTENPRVAGSTPALPNKTLADTEISAVFLFLIQSQIDFLLTRIRSFGKNQQVFLGPCVLKVSTRPIICESSRTLKYDD